MNDIANRICGPKLQFLGGKWAFLKIGPKRDTLTQPYFLALLVAQLGHWQKIYIYFLPKWTHNLFRPK